MHTTRFTRGFDFGYDGAQNPLFACDDSFFAEFGVSSNKAAKTNAATLFNDRNLICFCVNGFNNNLLFERIVFVMLEIFKNLDEDFG